MSPLGKGRVGLGIGRYRAEWLTRLPFLSLLVMSVVDDEEQLKKEW